MVILFFCFSVTPVTEPEIIVPPATEPEIIVPPATESKLRRVAVILYGQPRSMSSSKWISKLAKDNPEFDLDVFIHAWTNDTATDSEIVKRFHPLRYRSENPREFDPTGYEIECERHKTVPDFPKNLSQSYSREQAAMGLLESVHRYEYAIMVRMDYQQMHPQWKVRFDDFDKRYLHVGSGGYATFNDNCIISSPENILALSQCYSNMKSIIRCDMFRFMDSNYNPTTPEGILVIRAHQLGLWDRVIYHDSLSWVRPGVL
jgi:hypothetical protein